METRAFVPFVPVFGKVAMILNILKRFWQPIAAILAFLAAIILKGRYDSKLKKEGETKALDAVAKATADRELAFVKKSEKVAYDISLNTIPDSWPELERLSAKEGDTGKAKPPRNRNRKKVSKPDK